MLTEQVAQFARTSYVVETSIDFTLADLMLDTTKLTMCNHYCLTIYLVTEQNERNEYELELNNIQWIVDSQDFASVHIYITTQLIHSIVRSTTMNRFLGSGSKAGGAVSSIP